MEKKRKSHKGMSCEEVAFAIRDTMNAISGKWRLAVVGTIITGINRFTDIQRNLSGITPRMLSKELKELELNGVLRRIEDDPASVRYELTPSGKQLETVIEAMMKWGQQHRSSMVGRTDGKEH